MTKCKRTRRKAVVAYFNYCSSIYVCYLWMMSFCKCTHSFGVKLLSLGKPILTAEEGSVRRKTCPSAIVCSITSAAITLGLNPVLRG
jgi:hypothetical protein